MLSKKEILILGMMIFALFLGAGNIIFPPMEGYYAGENWAGATLGFVLTGVFLPFVTLVVVTLAGKGEALSNDLPKWVATTFWVILYLVIGSTFAMPRVTNVAYEMAWLPLGFQDSTSMHVAFAVIFNLIGMFFMLSRHTMISTVGKYMTPALLVLLVAVAVQVILSPLAPVAEPSNAYANQPAFTNGMIGGYQTMDVLAATAFGGIVANVFRLKNITDRGRILRYTLASGTVSIVLLSLLYASLFYLGATAHPVAHDASNGGQVFSRYVDALFGTQGVWIMSGIVLLANMTTLVGVTSACADYFSHFFKRLNYPFWVVLFTMMTIIISNIGLTELLRITIPALLLIYPIAIMLVVLKLCSPYLRKNSQISYRLVIATALPFSVADSVSNMGILPSSIEHILSCFPLYPQGLAWLLPSFAMLVLCLLGNAISKNNITN